jgi:hypothetical protein
MLRGEVNEGGESEEKTDLPTQDGVDMDDPEREVLPIRVQVKAGRLKGNTFRHFSGIQLQTFTHRVKRDS